MVKFGGRIAAISAGVVVASENPHLRPASDFGHPKLFAYLNQNRGRFVGAALTLVQAWVTAGQPGGKKTLGTYEEWSTVIGGILDVAGVSGFLGNVEDFYASADNEGAAWREFVRSWWAGYGPGRQTPGSLLPVAVGAGVVFEQWQEDKRKAELGTLLKQQKDTIYAGFAIRKTTPPRGASSAYQLEPKEGQTWEPPQEAERETQTAGNSATGEGPFGLPTGPLVEAEPAPGGRHAGGIRG